MKPMNGSINFLTSKLVNNALELEWKIKKDALHYLLNLVRKNANYIQCKDKLYLETIYSNSVI